MQANILEEAKRVMRICNACRYCEGFCAVFPAMEMRRTFTDGDLKYLANLCHDCRGCYYACQYAPPHEFDLNFPKTMAELRLATYQEASWPGVVGGLFKRSGWAVIWISLVCIALVMILTGIFQTEAGLFQAQAGPGSFYRVIPYWAMVLPFSAVVLIILFSLIKGAANLWSLMGGWPESGLKSLKNPRAHGVALWDVLRLKYLDGGGQGCNYPDDRFSMVRRYFHHAVFYGFGFCFLATVIAFIYDHLLGLVAPYPFWSLPVLCGTLGGLTLLVGAGGLIWLKTVMDRKPATDLALGMNLGFGVLLFLTSLSGLLLLALRDTILMGGLLVVHLGLVLSLFINLPYGKFVHALYRYLALVRFAAERIQEKAEEA
jgi:citrate/tricarballylate utilization protein